MHILIAAVCPTICKIHYFTFSEGKKKSCKFLKLVERIVLPLLLYVSSLFQAELFIAKVASLWVSLKGEVQQQLKL